MTRPTITVIPVAQNRIMVSDSQKQIRLMICGETNPTEMEITVYTEGKGNPRIPKRIIWIDPSGSIAIKGCKQQVLVDAEEEVGIDFPIHEDGSADWYDLWKDLSTDERKKIARGWGTDYEVMDAIAFVAAEDNVPLMRLWRTGKTPISGPDEVLERIKAYIIEFTPPNKMRDSYWWGKKRVSIIYNEDREKVPGE